MIARFVDISGIVDHHCINFLIIADCKDTDWNRLQHWKHRHEMYSM